MSDTRHDPVRGSGAEAVDGPLGRLVVVFDNDIARALATIAEATGWQVTRLDAAPTGPLPGSAGSTGTDGSAGADGADALGGADVAVDALVVCNHDGEGAYDTLRGALRSGVPYVAMMASRRRSAAVLDTFRGEGFGDAELAALHLPAGLDVGGRSAGEIALSVMAEVVAEAHGRSGGPMRDR